MVGTKVVLAVLVFCAVYVNSDDFYGRPNGMPEYLRIKRAKYYSNPPTKFYRRPPISHPVKGIFSYTPPPNYMERDEPHPGNSRPKVSKQMSSSTGLEDEDINNIVKHLSKEDLDKIIDFAGEKYSDAGPFEKYSTSLNKFSKDANDGNFYKTPVREQHSDQDFSPNGPFVSNNNYEVEYNNINKPTVNNGFRPMSEADNFSFRSPLTNAYQDSNDKFKNTQTEAQKFNQKPSFQASPQDLTNVPLQLEESMHNNQFSFANAYIQQELYGAASESAGISTFTDSKTYNEEQLPKPMNLREQDHEVSHTNNVPTIVKASSYRVENFGDLPLMDYSSKLDSVSSYHVPHYTVISPSVRHPSPASSQPTAHLPSYASSFSSQLVSSPAAAAIKVPKLEPAPPASLAKEQSDAHLKAIRIWTHKSKGTAYTLHDDGTLSLEKPGRPKPV